MVKTFFGLVLVALCAAGGVWGTQKLLSGDENGGSGQGTGGGPTRVGVAEPEIREIEDNITGVGTLMAVRSVELMPSVAGRVTAVPATSGAEVTEGETLVELDDRAARAALADAEATLAETEDEFRRVSELAESNTAAEARLEEARAAYRRAEAAVMSAEADLEDRTIIAPFAGTLGIVDIEPGAFLSNDTAVTTLVDLSRVELQVSLPERYFEGVQPGQTVILTVPAYPGETFEGEVTVRARQINLETRSFDIRAEIENSDGRLAGGMFANAKVVLDTYEGLAVPDDAIIREGLTSYVYTVSDGTAARSDVTPGASLGSATEITDGLEEGARVVVAGWDNLRDGAEVEIDEEFVADGLE